jgi:maltodextrin utilization protein YvdJ
MKPTLIFLTALLLAPLAAMHATQSRGRRRDRFCTDD